MHSRSETVQAAAMVVLLTELMGGCGEVAKTPPPESADYAESNAEQIDEEALARFITEQMEELHVAGIAVAIVDRDGIVFSAGYG